MIDYKSKYSPAVFYDKKLSEMLNPRSALMTGMFFCMFCLPIEHPHMFFLGSRMFMNCYKSNYSSDMFYSHLHNSVNTENSFLGVTWQVTWSSPPLYCSVLSLAPRSFTSSPAEMYSKSPSPIMGGLLVGFVKGLVTSPGSQKLFMTFDTSPIEQWACFLVNSSSKY